ncbi:MAG: hypothetical protein ACXV5H_00570 [Halobacteriota archaeon]
MAETESSIIVFRVSLRKSECLKPLFINVFERLKDQIHQSTDDSDIYYTPSDAYTALETDCVTVEGKISFVKTIRTDSIVVLHCSTYVKSYDYVQEEPNIKSMIVSKGYDIGICTGRSFFKYFCSDLIYSDRFFCYRFGNRKYWFICFLSTVDSFELIKEKLVELFGLQRGLEVLAWLEQKFN